MSFKLNIYLLKDNIDYKEYVIDKEKYNTNNSNYRSIVDIENNCEIFIVKKTINSFNKFNNFFLNLDTLKNVSENILNNMVAIGIVYNIEYQDKKYNFLVKFGSNLHILNPDCFVRNFGLKCIYSFPNSRDNVRELNQMQLNNDFTTRIERTLKDKNISFYSMDVEYNLVKSSKINFSKNQINFFKKFNLNLKDKKMLVNASTSINFSDNNINIENIKELLLDLLDVYLTEKYKEYCPWLDHIEFINDNYLLKILENKLINNINNYDENIWIAPPSVENSDINTNCYSEYTFNTKLNIKKSINELSFKDYFDSKCYEHVEIDNLKKDQILFIDENDIEKSINIYKCIYGEIECNKQTYVIENGNWYKIDNNYKQQIEKYYLKVMERSNTFNIHLPKNINYKKRENEINEEISKYINGYCLDAKIVQINKNHKFEICDILKNNKSNNAKQLIHIKKYGNASQISHLFHQGDYSINNIFDDEILCKINQKILNEGIKDISLTKNDNFEIVFLILGKNKSNIPFFAKTALYNYGKSISKLLTDEKFYLKYI